MGTRRTTDRTSATPNTTTTVGTPDATVRLDGRHVRRVLATALVTLTAAGSLAACGSSGSNPLQPWKTDPPSTDVMVVEGRPLRRGRRRRLHMARARFGALRVTDAATLALGREVRDELAGHWRRAGEMEHASVIAFEHVARRLRRLGAPADLVERCLDAALDEADHAERCFALASRFAGAEVCPGRLRRPLTLDGAWPVALTRRRTADLERLAVESVRDGVFNESYAAWRAAAQARLATDDQTITTLETIAADEAEHAALSADIVAWCVAEGGADVADAVARVPRGAVPVSTARPTPELEAHGAGEPDRDGAVYALLLERLVPSGTVGPWSVPNARS